MPKIFWGLFEVVLLFIFSGCFNPSPNNPSKVYHYTLPSGSHHSYHSGRNGDNKPPSNSPLVPQKAKEVLKYIENHGKPIPGYVGGRIFGNFEKHLPQTDATGNLITYREWDVNAHERGVNRGAERLITGSNHTAYFTQDHYQTFLEIQVP